MKRFSLEADYIQGICDMEEDPQGAYVLFSDFEKAAEGLQATKCNCVIRKSPPDWEAELDECVRCQTLKELGIE